MSKREVQGITKIYLTTRRLKIAGLYTDGKTFEFSVERDSKKNSKYFDLAEEFAKEIQSMIEG